MEEVQKYIVLFHEEMSKNTWKMNGSAFIMKRRKLTV
jgi:hypothetical protein